MINNVAKLLNNVNSLDRLRSQRGTRATKKTSKSIVLAQDLVKQSASKKKRKNNQKTVFFKRQLRAPHENSRIFGKIGGFDIWQSQKKSVISWFLDSGTEILVGKRKVVRCCSFLLRYSSHYEFHKWMTLSKKVFWWHADIGLLLLWLPVIE